MQEREEWRRTNHPLGGPKPGLATRCQKWVAPLVEGFSNNSCKMIFNVVLVDGE